MALVSALVYAPVAAGLVGDWLHDPNYSHGFLIPPVAAFLVWQRRGDLAAVPVRPSAWGLAGIAFAMALLVLGAAGAEVFTERMSLLVLLASGTVFLLGWSWLRRLAFPIAFLALAVPLPYVIYYDVTAPLQSLAAHGAVVGLKTVGIPVMREGNVLHLPGVSLEVAEACSGIRSLYAFLALGALFAYWLPVPAWGKVAIFLVTIPLSVAGNALRVWGSGVAAYVGGVQYAEGTPHELFGLVVFAAALGILALIGKGARRIWRRER